MHVVQFDARHEPTLRINLDRLISGKRVANLDGFHVINARAVRLPDNIAIQKKKKLIIRHDSPVSS